MSQALHAGYNLEFFIEGGRTRTGKPCLPKGKSLFLKETNMHSGEISALVEMKNIDQKEFLEDFYSLLTLVFRGNYVIKSLQSKF